VKPVVAHAKAVAVLLIALVSVGGQVTEVQAVRAWTPYLATIVMLAVALAGRGRGRVGQARTAGAVIVLAAVLVAPLLHISPGSGGSTATLRVLPLLIAAALAEEIIFRDDLLDEFTSAPMSSGLTPRRRVWAGVLLSQAAFAAVHLPALIAGSWRAAGAVTTVGVGLAATFTFGCLMAGMRMSGASVVVRSLHHSTVNFISIIAPLSLVDQVGRLLGMTVVILAVMVAVNRTIRRRRPLVPRSAPMASGKSSLP
jgi:membrane protease YdiL (CAAX protease family)